MMYFKPAYTFDSRSYSFTIHTFEVNVNLIIE